MQKISNVLQSKKEEINKSTTVNSYTVDSRNRFQSTVNGKEEVREKTFEEEMDELMKKHNLSKEGLAKQLAELLKDEKSVTYYELLLKENKPAFLFEWAHYVKDMDLQRKIRTNRAVYFQAVIRKHGAKTKFKKT